MDEYSYFLSLLIKILMFIEVIIFSECFQNDYTEYVPDYNQDYLPDYYEDGYSERDELHRITPYWNPERKYQPIYFKASEKGVKPNKRSQKGAEPKTKNKKSAEDSKNGDDPVHSRGIISSILGWDSGEKINWKEKARLDEEKHQFEMDKTKKEAELYRKEAEIARRELDLLKKQQAGNQGSNNNQGSNDREMAEEETEDDGRPSPQEIPADPNIMRHQKKKKSLKKG